MREEIPDEELDGEAIRQILCHPSIGYRTVCSMTGTWLLTRDGKRMLALFQQGYKLKRSYIEEDVLNNFAVSKAEFLCAMDAIGLAPLSAQSPGEPSPGDS